jgi:hypothetical protein
MPETRVMTALEFKKNTTPRNIFKRHRGTLLTAIDTALGLWGDGHGTHSEKAKALMAILKACRAWLQGKGHKTSETSEMRRGVIKELADQAFARLQFELFESHKENRPNVPLRGLQGAYGHERTLYEQSGKTSAPSGTTVHQWVNHSTDLGVDLNGKSFDQLTPQEFELLAKGVFAKFDFEGGYSGEPVEVCFLKKNDRIKKLVVIQEGFFYEGPNKLVEHGDLQAAYVIDHYGNLYVGLQHVIERDLPAIQRFNHSTFNAGKDVICAGMIKILGGKLKYVDNMSGHYKPTKTNLINALEVLKSAGVDLFAGVKVGLAEPDRRTGKMVMKYYNNAAAFLSNPNRVADSTVPID